MTIQNQPFFLHYQRSRGDEGISTMIEHLSSPNRQLAESDSAARPNPLFKSGTPAYKRMVDMIQDLVKTKSQQESPRCGQNQETSGQFGEDINNPIELQETPEVCYSEDEGNDKNEEEAVESPRELIFEEEPENQEEKQQEAEGQEGQGGQEQYEVDDATEEQHYTIPKKGQRSVQNKNKKIINQPKITPRRNTTAQNRTNTRSNKTRQTQQKSKLIDEKNRNTSKKSQSKAQKPLPQSKPIALKKSAPISRPVPKKRVQQQDKYEEGTIVIRIVPEKFPIPKPKASKKPVIKPIVNPVVIEDEDSGQDPWQIMQKSKKPSIEWIGFQVAVPLIISHKPKDKFNLSKKQEKTVEKAKSSEQFTPKMLLSKSKQMEVEMSFQDKVQMARKTENKINLGSYTLIKLVEQVHHRGLISAQLFKQFKENNTSQSTRDFLQKFENKGLRRFNFKSIQFTPLDHRRLSELLVNLYPTKYALMSESLPKDQSQSFITSSYGLTPKEYFDIYSHIDKISDIGWWSDIINGQKERIHEGMLRKKQDEDCNQPMKKRLKFT